MGFGNNGLAKANLHGANDQKVLAGGDRESVGAGFTDSGDCLVGNHGKVPAETDMPRRLLVPAGP